MADGIKTYLGGVRKTLSAGARSLNTDRGFAAFVPKIQPLDTRFRDLVTHTHYLLLTTAASPLSFELFGAVEF